MRILIAAVGRLKQGPERELAERYRKRAADCGRAVGITAVDIIEIRESRADNAEQRMQEEGKVITQAIPDHAIVVVLDERGTNPSSKVVADHLRVWRLEDRPAAVFVIGGHDGTAAVLRQRASLTLAFGAATWPHQLVRIMLLEQLYRAMTILSGHPYHRS